MKVENHSCNRAININGYLRSGQHGIAGWLLSQLPCASVFLNNLGPMGADRIWYEGTDESDGSLLVAVGLEGCYRRHFNHPHPTVFVVRDIKNHIASIIKHGGPGINRPLNEDLCACGQI